MKKQKLIRKLLSGYKNIRFSEAVECAEMFGFRLGRINGSHHIIRTPRYTQTCKSPKCKRESKTISSKAIITIN